MLQSLPRPIWMIGYRFVRTNTSHPRLFIESSTNSHHLAQFPRRWVSSPACPSQCNFKWLNQMDASMPVPQRLSPKQFSGARDESLLHGMGLLNWNVSLNKLTTHCIVLSFFFKTIDGLELPVQGHGCARSSCLATNDFSSNHFSTSGYMKFKLHLQDRGPRDG